MSGSPQADYDLEALLLRVLNRQATSEELARLNQILLTSSEQRSRACRFLCHDSLLTDEIGTREHAAEIAEGLSVTAQALSRRRQRLPPKEGPTESAAARGKMARIFDLLNHHGLAVASIAATLLIGLVIYSVVLRNKIDHLHSIALVGAGDPAAGSINGARGAPGAGPPPGVPPREVVGRISGLRDVVWKSGKAEFEFGDKVVQGQSLSLESGVVELLLTTGAMVTVEGPADFKASSATETMLSRGKIAAAAPRVARGYTVLTPTSELVDIGTQFGVIVEESGDTELHVFDGDVVARSLLHNSPADLIHARQDEAMRFDSVTPEPKRFAARELDFVRHLAPRRAQEELPSIPSTKGLTVWYTADMCNEFKEGDLVSTWRDLLVGENDFADDAWQFDPQRSPTLTVDGLGRPALRFDGWSTYMATSPMQATNALTVFVACSPAPVSYANKHHGGILLKYGDAPSMELSMHQDFTARGWIWPGPGNRNVGVVHSSPCNTEEVIVIAYHYDANVETAGLWVNGEHQGAATAPVKLDQPGRRYIGSHSSPHFRAEYFGSIYEIAMFDASLDDQTMASLWAYFQDRYSTK